MAWNLIPPSEWLETEDQVVEAAQYLYNSPTRKLGFDTETSGIAIARDYPILLSMSDGIRRFACYVEWAHHPWVRDGLFLNPNLLKIGTNIKFDLHMMANRGVQIAPPYRDTLVMDWLYDENRYAHDLKNTARDHCGIQMLDFKDVFPMKPKRKNQPKDTPGDAIKRVMADPEQRQRGIQYSGLDAYASVRVHDFLEDRLKQDLVYEGYSYWEYFLQWEVEFTRVLFNMERRGIRIATGHLKAQIGPIEDEIQRIKNEITRIAGYPVNPNSTKQLRSLFFDELGYKPVKYTDGGKSGVKQPSTDEETLTTYAGQGCPVSELILQARGLVKTKGTYIEGPLELVDHELKLHTTFKQHGTVTGRLSSSDPNLQNLPRASGDKFRIREAFVASVGRVLLVSDYAQLEMRLMAHFSQDERMIRAILDDMDLHCFTVSLMYNVPYEDVKAAKAKKEGHTDWEKTLLGYRQAAKATGFGLIYGIGPQKLGQDLTRELGRLVTTDEAKQMIRGYFDIFKGVERFINNTHSECSKDLFVRTILGRKRRLPGINARGGSDADGSKAKGQAAQARRQAVNSIIQGTAADIAKAVMIRCEQDQELAQLQVEQLLQVHDELVFELDDQPEIIDLASKRIQTIMEDPFPGFQISVPLPTEFEVAYTWADAK